MSDIQVKRRNEPKFVLLPNVLYDEWAAKIGPYATLVYIALNRYADFDDRSSFPSIGVIAEKLAISASTVKRAVRVLEEKGLVRVERRRGDKDQHLPNVYWLLEPWLNQPIQEEGVGSHRTEGRFPQNRGVGSHRTPNKTQENKTQELSSSTRPRNALLDALAVLCYGTLDAFKLKGVPAQLQSAANDLRALEERIDAEAVAAFGTWWGAEHWRGKRGERPKPFEVGAEYTRWKNSLSTSDEPRPVFGEDGRVTWEWGK